MYSKELQKPIHQIARRDFLNMTGLGVLAASIFPGENLGATTSSAEPAKIGLQLYTVRNQIEKNFILHLHQFVRRNCAAMDYRAWQKPSKELKAEFSPHFVRRTLRVVQ